MRLTLLKAELIDVIPTAVNSRWCVLRIYYYFIVNKTSSIRK